MKQYKEQPEDAVSEAACRSWGVASATLSVAGRYVPFHRAPRWSVRAMSLWGRRRPATVPDGFQELRRRVSSWVMYGLTLAYWSVDSGQMMLSRQRALSSILRRCVAHERPVLQSCTVWSRNRSSCRHVRRAQRRGYDWPLIDTGLCLAHLHLKATRLTFGSRLGSLSRPPCGKIWLEAIQMKRWRGASSKLREFSIDTASALRDMFDRHRV